jgi:hypothetical protein
VSFEACKYVLALTDVRGIDKLVLLVLAFRDGHSGTHGCFPSFSRLVKDCGVGRSTLWRSLLRLEAAGKIRIKHSKDRKHANYYYFPQVWRGVVAQRNQGGCTAKPEVVAQRNSNEKRTGDEPEPRAEKPRANSTPETQRKKVEQKNRRLDKEAAAKAETQIGSGPSDSIPTSSPCAGCGQNKNWHNRAARHGEETHSYEAQR